MCSDQEKEDARFNHTPGGEYSAYLYWIGGSATAHKQIGPAIALKVTAGDTVTAETWVRYENKLSYSRNTSIAALAALLGGNFSFTQPFETYTLSQTANTFSNALTAAGFMGDGSDEERPFAYINYILFDENMTMVDAGWKRVDEDAGFDPGQEALTFHQHKKLAFDSTIKVLQDGYIYIWVSNESEGTKVWFDDIKVTHTQVMVTQATDYGVWGDVLQELKADETTYRHGYQSAYSEQDQETGWNHFELREYDPVIGRWLVPDPYRQYWSPYVGMGNNPVNSVDPDGGFTDPPKTPGSTVGEINNGWMWDGGNWTNSFSPEVTITGYRGWGGLETMISIYQDPNYLPSNPDLPSNYFSLTPEEINKGLMIEVGLIGAAFGVGSSILYASEALAFATQIGVEVNAVTTAGYVVGNSYLTTGAATISTGLAKPVIDAFKSPQVRWVRINYPSLRAPIQSMEKGLQNFSILPSRGEPFIMRDKPIGFGYVLDLFKSTPPR